MRLSRNGEPANSAAAHWNRKPVAPGEPMTKRHRFCPFEAWKTKKLKLLGPSQSTDAALGIGLQPLYPLQFTPPPSPVLC
jgi:hypothetical protein